MTKAVFRDYSIDHPEAAQAYQQLKQRLAGPTALIATATPAAKAEMIREYTQKAKMEKSRQAGSDVQ